MPIPDQVLQLDRLFIRACRAIASAREEASEITERVAELMPGSYGQRLDWEGAHYDQRAREARRFASHVVELASDTFSRPGAPAIIRASDYLEDYTEFEAAQRHEMQRGRRHDNRTQDEVLAAIDENWGKFRPSAMWQAIAERYTPEAVALEAAQRAADRIVSAFELGRDPEVKTIGGRVELVCRVWSEDRFSGGRELSYSCRERVAELGAALDTFAVQALSEAAQAATQRLAETLRDFRHTRTLESRKRFACGNDVDLTTFSSAFKIRVPGPIAESLNAFVTVHGADAFARQRH